ncbi:MAG: hypothetical protein LBI26_03710 [Holosporales bacterium]|jgi:opacity protein-like surface antigen|nr:hypothetical protein [Holosporales bacterium]
MMLLKKGILFAMILSSFSLFAEDGEDGYSKGSGGSVSSVTGFYVGVDAGASHLKNTFSLKDSKDKEGKATEKADSDTGMLGDIFCGYGVQLGRFVFTGEGLMATETAKPVTTKSVTEISSKDGENEEKDKISQQRKYSFGFVPKVGFRVTNGLTVYVNCGTIVAKYLLGDEKTSDNKDNKTDNQKKSDIKPSLLVGLTLEYNFGSFFVKGEGNKLFKKSIIEEEADKLESDSYIFKIGAGYRF